MPNTKLLTPSSSPKSSHSTATVATATDGIISQVELVMFTLSGRNLQIPHRRQWWLVGVFNISDSHWVALAVDVRQRLILYGDSMEPVESVKREVTEAVQWWITTHSMNSDFTHVDLPITRQVDSFSCGVFAVNSVQHLVFPITTALLQPHDSVTERYRWFITAVNRHNEVVSHSSVLFHCTGI